MITDKVQGWNRGEGMKKRGKENRNRDKGKSKTKKIEKREEGMRRRGIARHVAV